MALVHFYFDLVGYFFDVVPIDAYASPVYQGFAVGGAFGVFGAVIGANARALGTAILKWKRGVRPFVVIDARSYVMNALATAPTVMVLIFVFLPLAAGARAADVLAGHSVRSSTFVGVPVLGLRATVVAVEKSPTDPPSNHCYILLGIGGTETTLFDKTEEKLYRFPSGELTLSMTGPAENC